MLVGDGVAEKVGDGPGVLVPVGVGVRLGWPGSSVAVGVPGVLVGVRVGVRLGVGVAVARPGTAEIGGSP